MSGKFEITINIIDTLQTFAIFNKAISQEQQRGPNTFIWVIYCRVIQFSFKIDK